MGAACNKINKPQKPDDKKLGSPANPKVLSNASLNGNGGSKAVLPMLQQPQLNSLVFDETKAKMQSSVKKPENSKDWSKVEGMDKIIEKITSFEVNDQIRESKGRALEIVGQLNFKSPTEAALTALQLMKKVGERDFNPTLSRNNYEINLKIADLAKDVKSSLLDVFHMVTGKLNDKNQMRFAAEFNELLARLIQLFQMMIFFKDLKIKEVFFKDQSDGEVLQRSKVFFEQIAEKLKNFLSSGMEEDEKELILQETRQIYLKSLYQTVIKQVFTDESSLKKKKISTNKMEFYLEHCDVEEDSMEENSFRKPTESLLITGVKKGSHQKSRNHAKQH